MFPSSERLILGLLALVTILATGSAQENCPQMADDGFAGANCCTTVTPTLLGSDQIPVMYDDGEYGVFEDCALLSSYEVEIRLAVYTDPGPAGMTYGLRACDELVFGLDVSSTPISFSVGQSSPTTARSTYILGKFSRTWTFMDSEGVVWQTWRYLGSGDATSFNSNIGTPTPDPIPTCYSTTTPQPTDTFSAVAFWGTIDISCGQGEDEEAIWRFSLSLSHYDGCLSHLPSPLNDRAITSSPTEKHVGYSYHLVNPKGFNWLAGAPVSSSLLSVASTIDCVRSTVTHGYVSMSLPEPQCLAESTTYHVSYEYSTICGCDTMTSGNYYPQNWLYGDVYCNSNPAWAPAQWVSEIPTGFEQIYLGRWNSAARDDVKDVWNFSVVGTIDDRATSLL